MFSRVSLAVLAMLALSACAGSPTQVFAPSTAGAAQSAIKPPASLSYRSLVSSSTWLPGTLLKVTAAPKPGSAHDPMKPLIEGGASPGQSVTIGIHSNGGTWYAIYYCNAGNCTFSGYAWWVPDPQ